METLIQKSSESLNIYQPLTYDTFEKSDAITDCSYTNDDKTKNVFLSPSGNKNTSNDSVIELEQFGMADPVNHCHSIKVEETSDTVRNQLIGVTVLCLLFITAYITGGALANSLALLTDATHLASDLISFIISLCAIWLSKKPATKRLNFGLHRIEVLGALASIVIIWVLTVVLVYVAVQRLINQDFVINADDMLITSGFGIIFNILMGGVLHSDMCMKCRPKKMFGHTHSHGSGVFHSRSHLETDAERNGGNNSAKEKKGFHILIRAAVVHVLGDFIQSICVFIAAIVIKFKPEYKLADPICTFLFSVLVICTTITIFRDILSVLMEAVPRSVDYDSIKRDLEKIDDVKAVHSLQIWALTVNRHVVAVHLAIDNNTQADIVLQDATRTLRTKYQIHQSIVQVENYQPIMASCDLCKGPEK